MKTLALKKVAAFAGGGTPSRAKPEYFGGGIPWVKTTDLNNGLIKTTEETLTALGLKKSSCSVIPAGAVLVAMYGGFRQIGRTGLLTEPAAINQALTAILPDEKRLHPMFLLEWLNFHVGHWRRLAGSSRKDPNITKNDVADFPVPVLPIDYQNTVVQLLQEWDESVELAAKLLSASEQRQTGLMRQLLTGRQRLKGFRTAWPKYRLRDLFTEVNRQPSTPVPVLSISAGRGFLSQKERFNREVSAATLANYTLIEQGEFAYNKGNSKTYTCGCIYALNEFEAAAIPSVYISFRPTTPINTRFFEFFFEADMLKAQLTRIINSGVRNDGLLNLATKDFFNMQIQVPDLTEQAAIAEVLNEAAEAARLQRLQLQALQQQKRALLQRLLSGDPT